MDNSLFKYFISEGVTSETIESLIAEEVLTTEIFLALKEQHFEKLLPNLKVGQHALLLKLHNSRLNVSYTLCYIVLILDLLSLLFTAISVEKTTSFS